MDMLEPVPVIRQGGHGTHDQHYEEYGLQRRSRGAVELDEAGVPDGPVDDAKVDEIDKKRLLRDGAEDVRQAV